MAWWYIQQYYFLPIAIPSLCNDKISCPCGLSAVSLLFLSGKEIINMWLLLGLVLMSCFSWNSTLRSACLIFGNWWILNITIHVWGYAVKRLNVLLGCPLIDTCWPCPMRVHVHQSRGDPPESVTCCDKQKSLATNKDSVSLQKQFFFPR